MTTTTPSQEAMAVVRRRLEGLLADDVVDDLLERIAEDLDAGGITAVPSDALERLQARGRIYRGALRQLGHAIEVAMADNDA